MLLLDLRSRWHHLAVTATLGAALLSGCSPTGAEGSAGPAEAPAEAQDLPVGAAGQDAVSAGSNDAGELLGDAGSRQLRVAGVECGLAAVGTDPDVLTATSGQFCRVDVDLVNSSAESSAFAVTSVSGTASSGPVAADARANTYAGGSPVVEVPAGSTTTASAYLDVPSDAGLTTVVVQRGWLDDDAAVLVG